MGVNMELNTIEFLDTRDMLGDELGETFCDLMQECADALLEENEQDVDAAKDDFCKLFNMDKGSIGVFFELKNE